MGWISSSSWKRLLSIEKVGEKDVRVLLITAHPDDEAMFFGPLLQALKMEGIDIHILCLTNGNFDGLGSIREGELANSVTYFGIQPCRALKIVNHPSLQDGMTNSWSMDVASKIIVDHSETIQPRVIVTFDGYGVSGHVNHIATWKATQLALSKLRSDGHSVKGLALDSVSLVRKFLGIIDIVISWLLTDLMVFNFNLLVIVLAMNAHQSQFVWYRKLFIWFSRYSYVNTFKEI